MAGITLEQAQERLTQYLAAEQAVLTGQKYEVAGRALTRANLAEIRDGLKYWDMKVKELSARSSGRRRGIVPTVGF